MSYCLNTWPINLSGHLDTKYLTVCLHILQAGWTGWEIVTWEKMSFSNTLLFSDQKLVQRIWSDILRLALFISSEWYPKLDSSQKICLHFGGILYFVCREISPWLRWWVRLQLWRGGSSMGGWGATCYRLWWCALHICIMISNVVLVLLIKYKV